MRADSRKQQDIGKGPQRRSGPAPEEQGENAPKIPPSIVDGKVGTEGSQLGSLTDRLVDGKETDPSAAARKQGAARKRSR
jgi:hypothetical protein